MRRGWRAGSRGENIRRETGKEEKNPQGLRWWRGDEKQRQRQTETEVEKDRKRQREKQRERKRWRQRQRETERWREREMDRDKAIETERLGRGVSGRRGENANL